MIKCCKVKRFAMLVLLTIRIPATVQRNTFIVLLAAQGGTLCWNGNFKLYETLVRLHFLATCVKLFIYLNSNSLDCDMKVGIFFTNYQWPLISELDFALFSQFYCLITITAMTFSVFCKLSVVHSCHMLAININHCIDSFVLCI